MRIVKLGRACIRLQKLLKGELAVRRRKNVVQVRRYQSRAVEAAQVIEELIATDQVFPDRVGEIYQLAHGPDQRWYWAPRMQRDEALLIKGWDSLDDGRARFTPHGAFRLEGQDPNAPPRESIEVRTYLMFKG